MAIDYVAAVRNAYQVAERKDLEGWVALFTPDGEFTDNSVGATYRGRDLAEPVRNYATAFSNMHRELGRIYTDANVVVVQLALRHPRRAVATALRRVARDRKADGRPVRRCLRTRRERQDHQV